MGSKITKRRKLIDKLMNKDQSYSISQALDILSKYKNECCSKMDETVEIVLKLGVDPRKTDQIVRGVIPMPHGLGKTVRVAVLTTQERIKEAEESGADIFGCDDLVSEIQKGKLDFDVVIATPDVMGKIGSISRILGPRGMMPNAKSGTVINDISEGVRKVKAGQVEYKTEKAGLIHAGIGKLSFEITALKENILALYEVISNAKINTSKQVPIKGMYISSTQSGSIKIDLNKVLD